MNTTVTGKDGDQVNTSIQVYDTEGNAHTMTLTFQKQANNLWNLNAAINPADGTMLRVNKDDFKVLVGTILIDPV